MGERYKECHKTHKHLDGKIDGCQEFMEGLGMNCLVCGCHRNFHRKVEVVYTKCHKMHNLGGSQVSVDGCQEFKPSGGQGSYDYDEPKCDHCNCAKSFHRNEITT